MSKLLRRDGFFTDLHGRFSCNKREHLTLLALGGFLTLVYQGDPFNPLPDNSFFEKFPNFCVGIEFYKILAFLTLTRGGGRHTLSRYATAISRTLEIMSSPLMSFNFKTSPKHR